VRIQTTVEGQLQAVFSTNRKSESDILEPGVCSHLKLYLQFQNLRTANVFT